MRYILALLVSITTANAADLPKQLLKAPVQSSCTLQMCSGVYVGASVIGIGSNMDIIGQGINNSVFAGGGMLGLSGGYQVWNGNYFAAAEVTGAYDFTQNEQVSSSAGNSKRYFFSQVVKLGYGLQGLFGVTGAPTTPTQGPVAITVPAGLANSLLSPYVQIGAVERPWGTGWATGAGAEFILASGWNLDISYLYAKYNNPKVNLTQSEASENLVKLSLIRKF